MVYNSDIGMVLTRGTVKSMPRDSFSVSPASDGGSSLLINICMEICISSLPMVGGSNPPWPH
jgi:hypothetical protein